VPRPIAEQCQLPQRQGKTCYLANFSLDSQYHPPIKISAIWHPVPFWPVAANFMKHHFAACIKRLAILQRINDELLRIAMFIFESLSSVMLRFFIYHNGYITSAFHLYQYLRPMPEGEIYGFNAKQVAASIRRYPGYDPAHTVLDCCTGV
jgi:hypothetical protein